MAKYINADYLQKEIEKEKKILEATRQGCGLTEYGCGRLDAFRFIDSIIDSLQQERPVIEEDWVEKRKQECGYRRLSANGNYQCKRYEGSFGPCDGRCSWIVDYPKLKDLKEMKQLKTDLDKEIQLYIESIGFGHGGWIDGLSDEDLRNIIYHFYEFRLNVRKEKN